MPGGAVSFESSLLGVHFPTHEVAEVRRSHRRSEEKALHDLGYNADLYTFNQDDSGSQQVDDVKK